MLCVEAYSTIWVGSEVKGLPYEGVRVYKSAVVSVSTVRRFYNVEALNFENLVTILWTNDAGVH